jgi:tryptophanyl-tRNA synthetase
LLTIYSALTGRAIAELEAAYDGKGYGDLKKDLAEVVVDFVTPFQQRTAEYLTDPAQLDQILAKGAEKARAVAAPTLATVYDRIGFLPATGR